MDMLKVLAFVMGSLSLCFSSSGMPMTMAKIWRDINKDKSFYDFTIRRLVNCMTILVLGCAANDNDKC